MKKAKLFTLPNFLLCIYGLLIGVHVFFPKSSGNIFLSSQIFLAQFYAFPILFGGLIGIFSMFMLLIGGFIHRRTYLAQPSFKFWLGVLIFSSLFAVGANDVSIQADPTKNEATFKLVAWNALNNLNEDHVELIFNDYDADIAVFPELAGYSIDDQSHQRLQDIFAKTPVDFDDYQVFKSPERLGGGTPVTVIVKKTFASYTEMQEAEMTTLGTVYLKSSEEGMPDIVGIHTVPPVPGYMEMWQRDLTFIADDIVQKYPEAIIVGDFNANNRHGAMNKIETHQDALNYLPFYQRGTWHVAIPAYLRTSIDHILLPKDQYGVKQIELRDFAESDHVGLFVALYHK